MPGGSDRNRGYECDENQGIGKTNPAHSGCGEASSTPPIEREVPAPVSSAPAPKALVAVLELVEDGGAPALVPLGDGAVLAKVQGATEPASEVETIDAARSFADDGTLPRTGSMLAVLALLGAAMLAAGLALRKGSAKSDPAGLEAAA